MLKMFLDKQFYYIQSHGFQGQEHEQIASQIPGSTVFGRFWAQARNDIRINTGFQLESGGKNPQIL